MKKIKGNPVSPGIIIGKALLYNSQREIILREKINANLINAEVNRFNNAVKKARAQLNKIYKNVQQIMGKDSALIIETQHMLLSEGNLINEISDFIISHSVRTEWAVKQVEKKYNDLFSNIADLSFQEKRNDISDVLNRILDNLQKGRKEGVTDIENVILVADDIPPSVGANLMSRGKLLGLVMDEGGETSHTVILARTLEIPTILQTRDASKLISNDDTLIVDGLNGEVTVNPSKSIISKASTKKERYQFHKERLREVIKLPDLTKDNVRFNLSANIELAFESEIVESHGAKGVGLFRTEFLFSDPAVVMSEKEQYMIYKNIAQKIFPNHVVIRTFDIGRDKNYDYLQGDIEANPALGTMAVRLFLKKRDLFDIQIKSILRANESGNIKILFPMITEIEEVFAIKRIIEEAKEELKLARKWPNKKIEIGIMIEIPGTVKLIKYLKDEIDFFSIGTNDLIQYLLAVDRNNSSVSYLFNPFHPAVVEVLLEIYREINKIGKEVVVCGETASHPLTALMLLGMGYTNFSMNPLAIAGVKRAFTSVHQHRLKRIIARLTGMNSRTEVEEFLIETLVQEYPDLFVNHPVF